MIKIDIDNTVLSSPKPKRAKKRIKFWIDDDVYDALQVLAKENDTTVSQIIRNAMRQVTNRNKPGATR